MNNQKTKKIAMQKRCIYCHKEQYAPAVYAISNGEHPCVWCGETPPVLIEEEYREYILKYKRLTISQASDIIT